MNAPNSDLLRAIPKVDRLLGREEFEALARAHSLTLLTRHLREALDDLRDRGRRGELAAEEVEPESIHDRVQDALERTAIPVYRRVINATGVILHTGLGRAPLPQRAVDRLAEQAAHPLRLEIDLESGDRGGRDSGCAELLCELTGAEHATMVNNNAAATMLILAALARGKNVILSRGELVEIGGSYRVPDVMEESGAILRAVGTTNRTHAKDYVNAIDEDTGMILKVHTSNYRIEGFTKEVEIDELAEIGRAHNLPVVHDLGSGCLLDLEPRGIIGEPHVSHSLRAGADLVCFSGDKLLGGPQSGLIIGSHDAVEQCRKHPLYRAMRPCRLTYMALETVLRIYREGADRAEEEIPALRRLLSPMPSLEARARQLCDAIAETPGLDATAEEDRSMAGSGSLPAKEIPTWGVRIRSTDGPVSGWAHALRTGEPAILPRVRDDALFLDIRTIEDSEFEAISTRLRAIANDRS
ncbi:MAG: L-seryl-tRNA(Sec) selenium transferase [Planctomycetota bacterium]